MKTGYWIGIGVVVIGALGAAAYFLLGKKEGEGETEAPKLTPEQQAAADAAAAAAAADAAKIQALQPLAYDIQSKLLNAFNSGLYNGKDVFTPDIKYSIETAVQKGKNKLDAKIEAVITTIYGASKIADYFEPFKYFSKVTDDALITPVAMSPLEGKVIQSEDNIGALYFVKGYKKTAIKNSVDYKAKTGYDLTSDRSSSHKTLPKNIFDLIPNAL